MTTPRGGIKLSREWASFLDTLDPKAFKTRLAKGSAIAGSRVGRWFEREARKRIRAKDYAPNSPVTVILKGSSTPLVDRGDLFQGLTYDQPDPYTVRLGVMRRAVGDQGVNVAAILHEGATINVKRYPQVRRAVFAKLRDSLSAERLAALNPKARKAVKGAAGKLGMTAPQRRAMFARQGRGGRGGTGADVWIIPARPFITRPLEDPAFAAFVVEQYGQAVKAAFGAGRG